MASKPFNMPYNTLSRRELASQAAYSQTRYTIHAEPIAIAKGYLFLAFLIRIFGW